MASEYTFDATLAVEAESSEQAADLILEHLMEADIACSLYSSGFLNASQLQARLDAVRSDTLKEAAEIIMKKHTNNVGMVHPMAMSDAAAILDAASLEQKGW